MTKAQDGFSADSGVQRHSSGDIFPITVHSVGGTPRIDNDYYWVVSHPAGTKRWCYTEYYRQRVELNFVEANEVIKGLDTNHVSERVAFELALLSIENGSEFKGYKLDKNGRGGSERLFDHEGGQA